MNNIKDSVYWIEKLRLQPHPEGGYYREVYRSDGQIPQSALPEYFLGNRNFTTTIYYMLSNGAFSSFHRIKSDEIWHFYTGNSNILIHMIFPDGSYKNELLGVATSGIECFQLVVPSFCWFAAELIPLNGYALVGCTVSPGFDFQDFELGKYENLIQDFPQHSEIIHRFTK